MNEITIAGVTMTSREIAELTGKEHRHVLRDIEVMLEELKQGAEGYAQSWTHPQNGQQYREFVLPAREVKILVTGYSITLRARVIDRLEELERRVQPAIPRSLSEALRLAADQAEQIEQQQEALALAAPKVEFVDRYVEATGSMGFRQVAKLLRANEREFRKFLLDEKVMYVLGGKLMPHAPHLDAGRFDVKTGVADNEHAFAQVRFTPKGVDWIAGKWAQAQIRPALAGEAAP